MINKIMIDIDYNGAYIILGLVTSYSDYQLAHHINKTLNIHFNKYDDFIFNNSSKNHPNYPWFYCFTEELKIKAYLIGNHHPYKKLLSDYKQIDYFFILENSGDIKQLNTVINSIRKIKNITGVFKLDLKKIKNIDLLLENNEMHQLKCVTN